ncbi:hypothetical protein OCU04_001346 [Sclerotinia nivalis]|uniref:F-box domain-containing protein n=1 Tax=Sclerotinia nivalis TaxID=352851 RepID=A0A9X0AXZ3_9HELO|nr:hypothetical protein OCU04_001346 [Sclerotinia nivalis]
MMTRYMIKRSCQNRRSSVDYLQIGFSTELFSTLRNEPELITSDLSGQTGGWNTNILPDITKPGSYFPMHMNWLPLVEHMISRKTSLQPFEPISGMAAIEFFYQALDCLRPLFREDQNAIWGRSIEWPHGYYGSRRFWWDTWDRSMERGWEFLCADPFRILSLTEHLVSNLELVPSQLVSQEAIAELSDGVSEDANQITIETLPVEILLEIISYLPLKSMLSLYRTNRNLHNRICPDQTF